MQSIEIEAKTVEEAVSIACEKLHTTKNKLQIEILEDEPGKILSFIGGKKAKIRACLNTHSPQFNQETVQKLKEILETIARNIHVGASVKIQTERGETVLNIIGDGSGIFIGKRGQTLDAFQYLINKIRMNKFKESSHVTVDSESYRSRHTESLVSLAKRLSEKAKKRRGPVTTNPLNASDRRVIHMTLRKDIELTTWSKGEGNLKRVIIAPRHS